MKIQGQVTQIGYRWFGLGFWTCILGVNVVHTDFRKKLYKAKKEGIVVTVEGEHLPPSMFNGYRFKVMKVYLGSAEELTLI